MAYSRNPAHFERELRIWDVALATYESKGKGVIFKCATKREASALRARLHAARRAHMETKGFNPYARFTLRLVGETIHFDAIGVTEEEITENMLTEDGEPIEPLRRRRTTFIDEPDYDEPAAANPTLVDEIDFDLADESDDDPHT